MLSTNNSNLKSTPKQAKKAPRSYTRLNVTSFAVVGMLLSFLTFEVGHNVAQGLETTEALASSNISVQASQTDSPTLVVTPTVNPVSNASTAVATTTSSLITSATTTATATTASAAPTAITISQPVATTTKATATVTTVKVTTVTQTKAPVVVTKKS
jgi:hypothetical protein